MTITEIPLENQDINEENNSSHKGKNRNKDFDEMTAKAEKKLGNPSPKIFNCGNYFVTPAGLFYQPPTKENAKDSEEKKESNTDTIWICSAIWPEAYLRSKEGKDHSLLLKVHDGEREHFWAMPKRLIIKINDINDILLDLGQEIPIYPANQKHLQNFLMQARPFQRLRCVDKSGWHGQQYIFPNGQVIGPGQEGEGVYPLNDLCPRGVEEKGSLKEWQDNVLNLCKGNSRLIFSIGTALSSLCLIDEDSGGFNFKGRSSIGKTKCLRVAVSVIGSRDYQRSWKTTSNGLEGVCALHNDSLLPLDEFGQQDAAEAGEIAYMIASGIGKQRASRDGSARDPRTWRVMVLSTGEVGLEGHLREGRKKVRAGQLARIADIPADACKGLGCFENLHHLANGGDFADEIDRLCAQYYGSAARSYVQKIVEYGVENARRDIRFAADDFVADYSRDHDGQVKRVARRFGLVYGALVLATKLGITANLSEEESKWAVHKCYSAWLEDRGTEGDMESHQLIEQVIGTLQENAEGKFVGKTDAVDEKRIRSTLWGYRDGATFYLLPKAFKEICESHDDPAKTLIAEGLLTPDGQGRSSQSVRIQAHYKKKDRFYVINLDYKNEDG
jgi:putative DNA primase/helicase